MIGNLHAKKGDEPVLDIILANDFRLRSHPFDTEDHRAVQRHASLIQAAQARDFTLGVQDDAQVLTALRLVTRPLHPTFEH